MLINDFDQRFQEVRQLIFIDENDFLREKCPDTDKLYAALRLGDALLLQPTIENDLKYKTYRKVGYLNRLVGCIATSLYYLKEALDYFEPKGGEEYVLTLINYGETIKHTKEYEKSLHIFEQVLTYCNEHNLPQFEDSVWQFKGKCYLEQGDVASAERCFYKAYTIRKKRNDKKMLIPSENALKYIGKIKR
ncbi:tetratricopeptide repeat protein [Metasolibacillus sp.]|uniref:tetratricopeptide repeat protein n=1 Tax=Metasolibacillus sp. TaxID=2703680 RepID=UPI0025E1343D|nr:tetratricopeptide repeat protein [Metasolibacillus sp.]MCT6923816.1 tetratricopeptide repeat protein [Metasolibacillus sp.]MCT6939951.1 tetratricopeptide repeat protein [Metasolibacillus sp.]